MQQILEEFPEAYFDRLGFLNWSERDFPISPERFHYFGKEFDELPKPWKWLPEWYTVIEEPKKLTYLEAAAEIGKGNKVKSKNGYIYPNYKGDIQLFKDKEPYTLVVDEPETIEIDKEVWVNVWNDGTATVYNSLEESDDLGIREEEDRIACEKFHLKRSVSYE